MKSADARTTTSLLSQWDSCLGGMKVSDPTRSIRTRPLPRADPGMPRSPCAYLHAERSLLQLEFSGFQSDCASVLTARFGGCVLIVGGL